MLSLLLSEANKLKNLQSYLEKNDNLLNYFLKYECDADLCDHVVNLEKNRTSQIEHVRNEIRGIWRLLNTEKTFLQEKNVNTTDLNSFKNGMVELQEKIHSLKSKISKDMEFLRNQEKGMCEITDTYNQKLTEWEKPIIKTFITYKHFKTASNTSHNKDVKEFMDFVNKSHGHENGWSNEDHQLFLKLRSKHKNIDSLASNLNKLLPDISIDAVKEHEIWYSKYLDLKNKKNEALEKWRRSKTETVSEDKTIVTENKNLGKIKVSKDEDIQEKIALWKAEKEAQRREKNAYEQMRKEQLKRLEEDKRRFNIQVKTVVKKWKEAKLIKEQHEKIQKELAESQEKKMKALEANKLIKEFQFQDDFFIAKVRARRLKEKNQRSRSKSSYMASRDPERILKPTKQWILRTMKDDCVNHNTPLFVPNIREIPKLRIPNWRKMEQLPTSIY